MISPRRDIIPVSIKIQKVPLNDFTRQRDFLPFFLFVVSKSHSENNLFYVISFLSYVIFLKSTLLRKLPLIILLRLRSKSLTAIVENLSALVQCHILTHCVDLN